MILPEFLLKDNKTLHHIEENYGGAWGHLITYPDSPLRATQNDSERITLNDTWKKTILSHPLSYLKHRLFVWRFIIARGQYYHCHSYCGSGYIDLLPFQLANLWIATRALRSPSTRHYGKVTIMISVISMIFIALLFFFTLAGVGRYAYFSVVMFFFSCPFAGACYLNALHESRHISDTTM